MNSKTKWLLVLIVTVLLGAVVLFVGIDSWKKEANKSMLPKANPQAGLGEDGAVCGGERRLPCRPGSICVITDTGTEEGVCVKGSADPGETKPYGRQ